MKRLIHISLRRGNIVLKSVWDRSEHIVDYTKYVIALSNCIDDNSYGIAIIYLVYLLAVTIYLFIDTIIAFNSTLDKGNRVKILFKPVMYLVLDVFNKLFTAALSELHLLVYLGISIWIKIIKSKIFKLIFN